MMESYGGVDDARVLSRCSNHPNVVPILDSYLVQSTKSYEVWVVLQFLQYGALTEALTQVRIVCLWLMGCRI